jgi:hypothetical protein
LTKLCFGLCRRNPKTARSLLQTSDPSASGVDRDFDFDRMLIEERRLLASLPERAPLSEKRSMQLERRLSGYCDGLRDRRIMPLPERPLSLMATYLVASIFGGAGVGHALAQSGPLVGIGRVW